MLSAQVPVFQWVPASIAAVQQAEPKHWMNVAETVHLLFKMTSI
jgi:hypothetical protein